jgi:hypothetical protein
MKPNLLLALTLATAPNALAAVDTGRNALSDVYEFLYFGSSADPLAEPDGDGWSNFEEMIWGADPRSQASVPKGATAEVEGNDLVLTWPGVAGKWYRLQSTTDLQTWETVTEGQLGTYRQPLASGGTEAGFEFWRVQVLALSPDTNGDGLDDWEEAIWRVKYGDVPSRTDIDGEGLPDAQEFLTLHLVLKKDHPAVGLMVFTPLEK